MIVLCLNCLGLGETQAVKDLRALLWRFSPRLVFLSKTKRSKDEMETVLSRLGDYYGTFVDARGRAGGLALLWDKNLELQIMSYSSHHIDATVRWHSQDPLWYFTGIYS